jgi:hypothetical protein
MQHPTFSAILAEQHRDELRRQANQACLARDSRPKNRRWHRHAGRWGRPATRLARAEPLVVAIAPRESGCGVGPSGGGCSDPVMNATWCR